MMRLFRVTAHHFFISLALMPSSTDAQEHLLAIDSVGSIDGDDSFGLIIDVAASQEGVLAVSQIGLGEVWVFDTDGKKVVGRRGEGPGEFGFVSAVAWRGDTLVVVEGPRSRVSLMASDGRYLRGHATLYGPAANRYGPVGHLRSGLTVVAPRVSEASTPAAKPLLLVGTDGEVVDSLGEIRHRRVSVTAMFPSGGGIVFRHPMPNYTRTALSPDGSYFATADERQGRDGSEILFVLYADTGEELGRTTVNIDTGPATDEDVLDRLSRLIGDLSKDRSAAIVRRTILDAVQLPDRRPALSSFLLDNTGRLWVGSSGNGEVVWRAWNIDGDLLRTWRVEPSLDIRQIDEGSGVVAIRRDDLWGWRVVFLRP
ncbi:MAG: hypothetical protein OXH49_15365 [Gemmatimonadetes bacterium]|nr:hypothetical protein [Gemmatimonadota bacterium]